MYTSVIFKQKDKKKIGANMNEETISFFIKRTFFLGACVYIKIPRPFVSSNFVSIIRHTFEKMKKT